MSSLTAKDTLSTSRPQLPAGRTSTVKNAYLTLYNFASAVLWASILGRTVLTMDKKAGSVYGVTGEFVKWTQTIALMEVGHSLFGEFDFFIYLERRMGRDAHGQDTGWDGLQLGYNFAQRYSSCLVLESEGIIQDIELRI
jgi:hypothetical protein